MRVACAIKKVEKWPRMDKSDQCNRCLDANRIKELIFYWLVSEDRHKGLGSTSYESTGHMIPRYLAQTSRWLLLSFTELEGVRGNTSFGKLFQISASCI